jgi:hypothetical protein
MAKVVFGIGGGHEYLIMNPLCLFGFIVSIALILGLGWKGAVLAPVVGALYLLVLFT